MPEMHFRVRWPDDSTSDCYSPSSVIRDYFQAGQRYALPDFVDRSRTALNLASDRVRAKYGYACSSAMDQLARIELIASSFSGEHQPSVLVEAISG